MAVARSFTKQQQLQMSLFSLSVYNQLDSPPPYPPPLPLMQDYYGIAHVTPKQRKVQKTPAAHLSLYKLRFSKIKRYVANVIRSTTLKDLKTVLEITFNEWRRKFPESLGSMVMLPRNSFMAVGIGAVLVTIVLFALGNYSFAGLMLVGGAVQLILSVTYWSH